MVFLFYHRRSPFFIVYFYWGGSLPQEVSFFHCLLLLGRFIYAGLSAGERHERAAHALERVGLGKKLHNKPSQLSGGQQQRVSIARALAGDPAVILADEPTGALDSHTSREVLGMLQKLHREGNTVVLITHDNSIAVQAERIIRLKDGYIVYDGDAHAPEAVVQPGVRAAGGEGCA